MSQSHTTCSELAPNVVCARCGAPFTCGFTAGAAECWCMHTEDGPHLPVPEPAENASCLCPACLRLARAQHGGEAFSDA